MKFTPHKAMKTLSLLLSLIAVTLSAMMFWGDCFHPTSDSLISVIAICTTIIVGTHFLDAWTIHSIEERQKKLSQIEKELIEMKQSINIALHLSWGLSFISYDLGNAFQECWKAFEMAISFGDAIRAKTCLDCIEKIIRKDKDKSLNERIQQAILQSSIKSMSLYKVFKDRIDALSPNKQS